MTELPELKPLFDYSDKAEYLADDIEVEEDAVNAFESRGRNITLVVRNLMPRALVEDTVPEIQFFGEWNNDFAEYHAIVDMVGPADAKLGNDRWHAGNGYLLEMLQMVPVETDEEGRTYSDLRLRVFCTALDEDPLEMLREWPEDEKPEVDSMLQSVNRNLLSDAASVLLDVRYYHAEDDE